MCREGICTFTEYTGVLQTLGLTRAQPTQNLSVLSTSCSWHKQRTQPNRALLMLPAVDRTTETGNLDAGVGFEHHDL